MFARISALCLLLTATTGCGGGDEETKKPDIKRVGGRPAVAPVSAIKAKPIKPAGSANSRKKKESKSNLPPHNPEDLFVVMGDDASPYFPPNDTFEFNPDADSRNRFEIVAVAEQDSSHITIDIPNTGSPSTGGSRSLPEGFVAVPGFGSSDGLPLRIRCTADDSLMALVPAGPAVLGSNESGEVTQPAVPIHEDAFYMDVQEVTLRRYLSFAEAQLKARVTPLPKMPANRSAAGDFPALGISWRDALGYCRHVKKELPTEAEWEKAARGSKGFPHPWGYTTPIWHQKRELMQISEVGSYPNDVSPYGILDLAGNAREWCADWFSPSHRDAAAVQEQPVKNWEGPKRGRPTSHRVVKGNGPNWDVRFREGKNMSDRPPEVGFRGVLRLTPNKKPANSASTDGF